MKEDVFLQRIAAVMEPYARVSEKVIVALSGGADSVCLLLALKELGYEVMALHCNFELRGRESDGDEAFCRKLCRALQVPLEVKHFRTRSYADRKGISIEMAARELRYAWFREEKVRQGAALIAVAHHKDDAAETFFLNLLRGTGIRGLSGMKVLADDVVRPLLGVTRAEIEEWLQAQGQTWVVDSTNLDADAAQRNKIRLELMPILKEMKSDFLDVLQETTIRLHEAERLYDEALQRAKEKVVMADGSISLTALHATVAPQTVLLELLTPYGYSAAQVKEIFAHVDGCSGKVWESATHRLLRDRDRLLLLAHAAVVAPTTQYLPLEGYVTTATSLQLKIERKAVTRSFVIPKGKNVVCMDVQKLTLPLVIRTVQRGDRFQPFGMEGTRLVSDVLTDAKLTLFEKERQLVVESAGEIVWVVGQRAAAGYEVTDATAFAMTISLV